MDVAETSTVVIPTTVSSTRSNGSVTVTRRSVGLLATWHTATSLLLTGDGQGLAITAPSGSVP